jgi:hypothetical protein
MPCGGRSFGVKLEEQRLGGTSADELQELVLASEDLDGFLDDAREPVARIRANGRHAGIPRRPLHPH